MWPTSTVLQKLHIGNGRYEQVERHPGLLAHEAAKNGAWKEEGKLYPRQSSSGARW